MLEILETGAFVTQSQSQSQSQSFRVIGWCLESDVGVSSHKSDGRMGWAQEKNFIDHRIIILHYTLASNARAWYTATHLLISKDKRPFILNPGLRALPLPFRPNETSP